MKELELAARALAANPFLEDRATLDLALTEGRPGEAPFEAVLARLEPIAADAWRRSDGSRREVALRAYLFALFHRMRPAMAEFVGAEVRGESNKARFAVELARTLDTLGLHSERSNRLVALFYQTERAFLGLSSLAGQSRVMRTLRASLWNALFTHDVGRYEAHLWDRMEDFSTLLLGETGTGKSAAAAALGHGGIARFDRRLSSFTPPRGQRFVTTNLAEVPDSLVESHLFGHERGAFTGADRARIGVFGRVAEHGTVFLDELGDLPLHIQGKLLRVLQERSFEPLGSETSQRFRGRIVAATHRPLERMRAEGRFRDDLYFRLATEAIEVPALRTRIGEDRRELTTLVLTLVTKTLGEPLPQLAVEVERAIERAVGIGYAWPGNVRELEQCVRQVLLTGAVRSRSQAGSVARLLEAASHDKLSADAVVGRYLNALHAELGTYEAVARIAKLDRRTVKRHVESARADAR